MLKRLCKIFAKERKVKNDVISGWEVSAAPVPGLFLKQYCLRSYHAKSKFLQKI